MTTPSAPGNAGDGDSGPPVDLGKAGDPTADAPFDPYRFGKPDRPVPPEFAPPGYGTGYQPPAGQPAIQPPQYPAQYPAQYPPPYGGYGAPPPPPYHGYPQPRTGNGKAVAALVLGILSVVMFWLSIFDALLVIPALVLGLLGLQESKTTGNGRGLAIAGLICMGIGAIAAVVWTFVLVHAANQCGGFDSNTGSSEFQQCVTDHL